MITDLNDAIDLAFHQHDEKQFDEPDYDGYDLEDIA